jgi:riboflavin transporter FmnP
MILCDSGGDSKGWMKEDVPSLFQISLEVFLRGFSFLRGKKGENRNMQKEKRKYAGRLVSRMATVAVLAALGAVFMIYAKIPWVIPWLEFDVSDVVVLIVYAMYGAWPAVAVAVIKAAANLLVYGGSGIYFIGDLTALLSSLSFIFGLFLTSHVFKLFKRGLWFRLLGYVVIILLEALILTGMNVLFITPTYLTNAYTTCFNSESVAQVEQALSGMGYDKGYFLSVNIIYLPFNLVKSLAVCAIYEIVFNRLIFILMQRSPFMKKYFVGTVKESREQEKTLTEEEAESILLGNEETASENRSEKNASKIVPNLDKASSHSDRVSK